MPGSQNEILPKELSALVQHIELNKAGWWEKTVERLVLTGIWLNGQSATKEQVLATLSEQFGQSLTNDKFNRIIDELIVQGLIVQIQDNHYRIPDQKQQEFAQQIEETENCREATEKLFIELINHARIKINPNEVWKCFESDYLEPLIKFLGVNAYNLIIGHELPTNNNLLNNFLEHFPETTHPALKKIAAEFLNPKNDPVRSYVSKLLLARFAIEAQGLSQELIDNLQNSFGQQVSFKIFVDTNFLFSLLEIHQNPSNQAASELRELISNLGQNPKVTLHITPRTINEAISSINGAKNALKGISSSLNIARAALNVGCSGLVEHYFSERAKGNTQNTPDEWFSPYISDFIAIAREKGIEFYNNTMDEYPTKKDVVDDIHQVQEFEVGRYPKEQRKSFEKIQHDLILWHFVKDKRPGRVESPIDAENWVLTLDFRLIGFDKYKSRQLNSPIPICLHPTSLIQLLQFWIPRTKAFEEAMLGSLRLPLLFQDFDIEAEKTSIRILKGLSKHQEHEGWSEETITQVVLNEGLRGRLQENQDLDPEGEIELIQNAFLDEAEKRVAEEAIKVQQAEDQISELKDKNKQAEDQTKQFKETLEKKGEELDSQAKQLSELQTKILASEKERNNEKKKALQQKYILILVLIILGGGFFAWKSHLIFPDLQYYLKPYSVKGFIFLTIFAMGHFLFEWKQNNNPLLDEIPIFIKLKQFRNFIWGSVILAALISIFTTDFQNDLNKVPQKKPSSKVPVISSPKNK